VLSGGGPEFPCRSWCSRNPAHSHSISTATTLLLSSTCLLFASVQTDFDHKADFGRYHTYSWIGVRAGDSIWQNRITAAVDSALAAKGWTKVESGGDASVSAVGKTTERDTLETFYTGFPGWGWRAGWRGGGMGTTATEVVPERVGNLTVDIFDGGTSQLIFRGQASDSLSGKPEKNEKKMEHSVDRDVQEAPFPERIQLAYLLLG
jgi:hypothetical protein